MASNKVSMFEKISFGSGDLGCTIIWNVVGMFLTIYYTDDVKISAAAVGSVFSTASQIWSWVTSLTALTPS